MQSGDLRVDVSETGSALRLDWRGKSNAQRPEAHLNTFLNDVAMTARTKRVGIEMHFEQLEFFNSATITVIIQHVKALRERGIRLVLSYKRTEKWQRVFFDALKMFEQADGLLKIVAVDP